MSLDKYISFIVKSCFPKLHDYRCIHTFISKTAALSFLVANAFVHVPLDFLITSFMAFLTILFIACKKENMQLFALFKSLLAFFS